MDYDRDRRRYLWTSFFVYLAYSLALFYVVGSLFMGTVPVAGPFWFLSTDVFQADLIPVAILLSVVYPLPFLLVNEYRLSVKLITQVERDDWGIKQYKFSRPPAIEVNALFVPSAFMLLVFLISGIACLITGYHPVPFALYCGATAPFAALMYMVPLGLPWGIHPVFAGLTIILYFFFGIIAPLYQYFIAWLLIAAIRPLYENRIWRSIHHPAGYVGYRDVLNIDALPDPEEWDGTAGAESGTDTTHAGADIAAAGAFDSPPRRSLPAPEDDSSSA